MEVWFSKDKISFRLKAFIGPNYSLLPISMPLSCSFLVSPQRDELYFLISASSLAMWLALINGLTDTTHARVWNVLVHWHCPLYLCHQHYEKFWVTTAPSAKVPELIHVGQMRTQPTVKEPSQLDLQPEAEAQPRQPRQLNPSQHTHIWTINAYNCILLNFLVVMQQ